MKRTNVLLSILGIGGFFLFGATSAFADDCVALGGTVVGTECQINSTFVRNNTDHGGVGFTIDEDLRICGPAGACAVLGSGKIVTSPSPQSPGRPNPETLTISVTGKFIMEDGSAIIGDRGSNPNNSTGIGATISITASGDIDLGDATISSRQTAGSCGATGIGGNISLTSSGGNITANTGSLIDSGSAVCPAGDITIATGAKGKIDLDGEVLAQGFISGTGTRAGGGRITVNAGCDLLISDTGVVSSKGADQGADLVHLQGCKVTIQGLVESTVSPGGGHADSVDNACNTNPTAHPQFATGVIFTACVEIWSGTTIVIDKKNSNGEVNTDGITANSSWIDLFANGDITITGDTAPAVPVPLASLPPPAFVGYAVHANAPTSTNNTGGLITVKSKFGDVNATDLALSADSTGAGGRAGAVIIQAGDVVDLDTAFISAKGDDVPTIGFGGHVTTRSFSGSQSWQNGFGDVRPTGTGIAVANRGVVTFQVCATGTEDHTGTQFPFNSGVQSNPVIDNLGGAACGGSPDFQLLPAAVFPAADCNTGCTGGGNGDCEKATVKSVLDPLTGRFPGNAGPDLVFRLDLGQDNAGNTSIQQSVTNVTDLNNDGYLLILVVKDGTGKLGGSTVQAVDISLPYLKTFGLLACSVTLIDPDLNDGLPAGLIEDSANSPPHLAPPAPGNIFVMDLHGSESEIAGWVVVGDGRYMRNVATHDNALAGIAFIGNNNTMHNGNGNDNDGPGIYVQGSGNLVDSSDAFGNDGNGVTVVGSNNKVLKVDAGDKGKGNTGDGVNVSGGNGNWIQEVDAYANTGNGIAVTGNGNTLLKNNAGDKGKGNTGDGINVNGSGNLLQENEAYANVGDGFEVNGGTALSPNRLYKNKSGDRNDKANQGNGFLLDAGDTGNGNVPVIELQENTAVGNLLNGFLVQGSGHQLKGNVSGGSGSGYNNGVCNFDVVAGNINNTGNKSAGVTIPGVNGSAFPTGCK